ncbi:glycosyltransferase [Haloplanus aerogenes]|uniref:Glycosyl transferase family 2 n=1 Tax=Haloplanus aerogenes TaxID=660522 RepID=A0A3M0D0T4_9EURY|nr:glycosyltransferase family A protein [Haloplanus aerogenes]AZH24019.1 glycosyltransferase family 2 protein [Haloplanus aerogenes]RMB13209.1 glycosyl transferase family 2 [Haloplanus aerogenes]
MGIEYVRRAATPAISVVVPSVPAYDHEPTITRLERQELDAPYEIVLVDDGEIDRSAARNRGLEAASADVVALTDDDTRPPDDWLATALAAFEADPDLVCLEGPVYGGCRSFGPRHYVGCNLAVRRGAAIDVGGFRSTFSEWREDVEFGWRMEAEADGHCRFEPSFRMCHPEVPRTAFDAALERRLKGEYPERYAAVMDVTLTRRLYRRARAAGITQPIQRVRNAVGRRIWGECRGAGRFD